MKGDRIKHLRPDKYGRGSAAANGAGFVDLAPGDTFDALEKQLCARIAEVYVNPVLGISASIGSKRNANELAKHMARGEGEEVHKFAAKNIGVLFERGQVGIRHFDKKAVRDEDPKPVMLRVFSRFEFDEAPFLATITLRAESAGNKLYAVEAVDITKDAWPERTPRGGTAPFLDLASFVADSIAYYIGDCNRTHPEFVNRSESFTISRSAELLIRLMRVNKANRDVQQLAVDISSLAEYLADMKLRGELGPIGDPSAYAQKLLTNAVFFGLRDDENLVALCALYCNRPEKDFAFIPQINVSPEYRHKGLASAMLQRCMSYARENGYAQLRLFVDKSNAPARALYAKHGFVRAGETDSQYECALNLR